MGAALTHDDAFDWCAAGEAGLAGAAEDAVFVLEAARLPAGTRVVLQAAPAEAAAGGEIALIRTGDLIEINIIKRSVNAVISDNELLMRQEQESAREMEAYKPKDRRRIIPASLRAYAATVSSADRGAVRII